jgi:hypothetical protein
MKWLLFVAISFSLTNFANAKSIETFEAQGIKGSLSSREQDKILQEAVLSVPSNDPKINAIELNKKLKELGLPLIDVNSPDLKVSPTMENGFAASTLIGAEFSDGKHRYCLPCENGWNSFESGISKMLTSEELFQKNKAQLADFLGSCEYDLSQTTVMEVKGGKGCGPDGVKYVCKSELKCSRRSNGAIENMDASATCLAPGGLCPTSPLDCFASRSFASVKRGAESIGDSQFPQKASGAVEIPKPKPGVQ